MTHLYPDNHYIKCSKCPWRTLRFGKKRRHGTRRLVIHFIESHWEEGGKELYERLERMEDEDGEEYVS